MGMYNDHKSDKDLERTGVWVDYGSYRVKVAKAGGANRQYLKMIERETKPIRRAMQAGTLTDERAKPIMIAVFAKTIVSGWQCLVDGKDGAEGKWVDGIEQPDGSIGKYTDENVTACLTNLEAVFNLIKADAMSDDIYLATVREEEAGN